MNVNQMDFQRKVIREEYIQPELLKKVNPSMDNKINPRHYKKPKFRESVK